MISDTDIYKNTYAQLVAWIKELINMRRDDATVYDRNIRQARRIMELEFDLRKYRSIMVDKIEEDVVKEYGSIESNVISNEELMEQRLRRGGRGGGGRNKDDFLSGMIWGTQFYVRQRDTRGWMLVKFMYAAQKKHVHILIPMKGDENEVSDDREWLPVEGKSFCKYWELVSEFPPPTE